MKLKIMKNAHIWCQNEYYIGKTWWFTLSKKSKLLARFVTTKFFWDYFSLIDDIVFVITVYMTPQIPFVVIDSSEFFSLYLWDASLVIDAISCHIEKKLLKIH